MRIGEGLTRLRLAWLSRPTAITLPIFMLVIGLIAIVLGDGASRAFATLGGASVIRIMGIAMFGGGAFVVASVVRVDPLLEAVGLVLTAFGSAVYSVGVISGLKVQGLIAGLLALGIAVGLLGRVRLLLVAGRTGRRHGG